ncbi:alanine racemase [Streptomyces sp. WAC08241]|uniref:alanine racemase n=1 Tax=Streptomyces sp. WAC08241 TaxID=2487421 RepID=UPI000F7AA19E|nr:alanine racemase [Streptomyces sp. WAC08241]RSS37125.1 alanine racemase [Streptomyces sp. WAC08241]
MSDERRHPLFRVDLAAVAANTRLLRARAARCAFMAVVKADAFGHGALPVASTVLRHGADRLGTATVAEALDLRRAGLDVPILSWLNAPHSDFTPAVANRIDLAVPGVEHLRSVAAAALAAGRPARIHLHADVGMARDGAAPDAWPELCGRAAALEAAGTVRVVGLMGHLGCADHPGDPHNVRGRAALAAATLTARRAGLRPRHRHLAATAALLNDPGSHADLVRPGAGLYGIDPTGRAGLRFAATLSAPVVSVRDVPAGTPVGYGHTFTTERATRLALLPLGYADGLPRTASARARVLIRGRRRPVAGTLSMDQLVVDVGDAPVTAGEVATVFGPGDRGEPTPADWARWAGTLPHEILTALGAARRVHRHHLPHPAPAPARATTPAETRA